MFLVSTSLVAVGLAGTVTSESARAQSGSGASTLPPVTVDAPGATRVRRAAAPQRAAGARRASRGRAVVQAPPVRQPPSVNSQDGLTGQTGYITGSTASATRTNTALINIPQSVSVLTKEFIKDQAFTSMGEDHRWILLYRRAHRQQYVGGHCSRQPRRPRAIQHLLGLEQISVHADVGRGGRCHPLHNFYASSDDTVLLPEFTRVDAAVFFRLNDMWRAQLNVENVLDRRYIATADGNNNITPGSPRVFRLSAIANF
jgi:outer membrane receptor for ferric coprogen and ferric-rhodotorulic acid